MAAPAVWQELALCIHLLEQHSAPSPIYNRITCPQDSGKSIYARQQKCYDASQTLFWASHSPPSIS